MVVQHYMLYVSDYFFCAESISGINYVIIAISDLKNLFCDLQTPYQSETCGQRENTAFS